jgi:hypothetical protein
MDSLLKFIQRDFEKNPEKVDAVFLVGDIAQSGKQDEYTRFESEFLNPLLKIPVISGAKIFAVPGNHDVDCDESTAIAWNSIGPRNHSIYFCENDEGKRVRKSRASVFRNYWDFAQRNKLISPNPFEEVSVLSADLALPPDRTAQS